VGTHLVVIRHSMDDIPFKLCTGDDSLAEALRSAKALREKYDAEFEGDSFCVTPRYFGVDASTPINVAIVEFDEDGMAIGIVETVELEGNCAGLKLAETEADESDEG
jgi:hypothetical protein